MSGLEKRGGTFEIDSNKIGKKGFPLHYQAYGLEPPMKEAALETPPEPSPPGEDDYRRAIQGVIDSHAQSRRYDSGNSLATYVTSSNPDWAAEAQAFVIWRDAVWAYAYVEMDKVLAGERKQPSVEDFIGELPQIVWPI